MKDTLFAIFGLVGFAVLIYVCVMMIKIINLAFDQLDKDIKWLSKHNKEIEWIGFVPWIKDKK